MNIYLLAMLRRFRPSEGWGLLLLAVAAVLCVRQGAADAKLDLPVSMVGWAGLFGLLGGRLLAPAPGARRGSAAMRWIAWAVVWVGGIVFAALAVGGALPPLGLMLRDVAALAAQPFASAGAAPPAWDSIAFLGEALPRFRRELANALFAGERGALLIVSLSSVLLTWSGGVTLGAGLRRPSRLLGWALLLLAALAITVLLGGGNGAWLFIGLATQLILLLQGNIAGKERRWEQRRMDFPSDVRIEAALWGTLTLALVLPLAALLPFAFDNPIATAIWNRLTPPSGLAAIDSNIRQAEAANPVSSFQQVAGSVLPEITLGNSLEDGPPGNVALRVWVSPGLPEGPWPHYWRSRVLATYNGSGWRSASNIFSEPPLLITNGLPPQVIAQDVQDLRFNRTLVYGLPEIVGLSASAQAERLTNGQLTALISPNHGGRYRVYSFPTELAPPPPADQQAALARDMAVFLALPSTLPPRVADLARTLTRESATKMDAALALEHYLRGLPYSYSVQPLPGNGDAVDQFLFDMRSGYCTYYASSFAVMARTLGIPARISMGYSTGTFDQVTGAYIVLERNAHAWPELYLDGRWLAFEPTPVLPLPNRNAPQTAGTHAPVAAEPLPATPLWDSVRAYLPGALVLLLLLLILSLPLLPSLLRRARSPLSIQRQLERRGRRAGVPWPAGATLHEYGRLLQGKVQGVPPTLDTVVDLLEEGRYRDHPLDDDEQLRLREAWEATRRGL